MWSRRFKGGEISEYGLKFSRKLAELVGQKLEMAPNRMFQQLTDKTKKKQEIFKNFQATTVTKRFNIILLSLPHWIQHTRICDENRDFRKSGKPLMKTGHGMPPMM